MKKLAEFGLLLALSIPQNSFATTQCHPKVLGENAFQIVIADKTITILGWTHPGGQIEGIVFNGLEKSKILAENRQCPKVEAELSAALTSIQNSVTESQRVKKLLNSDPPALTPARAPPIFGNLDPFTDDIQAFT